MITEYSSKIQNIFIYVVFFFFFFSNVCEFSAMEANENNSLVEPIISGEEEVTEWSSEANVDAPLRGALIKLSGLPDGANLDMIKEVLLRLSAPVYFVDVY